MASFIDQGENFQGSEVVLIDLNEERLQVVKTLSEKMARCRGLDLKVTAAIDRRTGLDPTERRECKRRAWPIALPHTLANHHDNFAMLDGA